jgi:hypothetical protein
VVLYSYVRAREDYNDGVNQHVATTTAYDAVWFDERIAQFQRVAAKYVKTPNAHTGWLTSEISAWLLRPCADLLGHGATRVFPANRIGARRKAPWSTLVPIGISVLLFLLACALIAGCYLFVSPTVAYVVAGLCGLLYIRRYIQWREFNKERARITRLWHKVSHLHNEVKSGAYNPGEIIRVFRNIVDDDALLPSVFVSVIALPESPS